MLPWLHVPHLTLLQVSVEVSLGPCLFVQSRPLVMLLNPCLALFLPLQSSLAVVWASRLGCLTVQCGVPAP